MKKISIILLILGSFNLSKAQLSTTQIDDYSKAVESKVIAWRRDFHQNPELGNLETRTAKIIADHLRSLGIEVQENVAFTGVIGVLKGAKPGPVIALRADMDGLPVSERVNVPFKSNVTVTYNDQKTGVMHACGHDSHMAILMGTAEVLSKMKANLQGTVKFIFQPAEEGVSDKSVPFGADGMIKAGCLENPKVDIIFGLHISSQVPVGTITLKPGALMAAVDELNITVKGKQSHGAYPWGSADPIVASAQIINNLQAIVSRNVNLVEAPAVVTVGAVHGGIRHNIIPEEVKMIGTIRTLGKDQRTLVHRRIKEIVENTGESAGVTGILNIVPLYPVTVNNESLTDQMMPTLKKVAGDQNVKIVPPSLGAEDFSFYQEKVPGMFFFLGGMDPDMDVSKAPPHHTPDFYINESGFILGVKAFCNLINDYNGLTNKPMVEVKAKKKK